MEGFLSRIFKKERTFEQTLLRCVRIGAFSGLIMTIISYATGNTGLLEPINKEKQFKDKGKNFNFCFYF